MSSKNNIEQQRLTESQLETQSKTYNLQSETKTTTKNETNMTQKKHHASVANKLLEE